jgi:hypothetical protein
MDKVFNLNRKTIAIMGILLSCIYFFVVITFVATGSINWLMIFDILTMFSGIYFAFLIIILLFSKDENIKNNKIMAIVFVSVLMIITNIAHSINLTSIQNIKKGINIPDYFQIGKPSSFITSIEYLGWGIFLGLAFLFFSLGITNKQELKSLKITLFICSCLCIIGFFGWLIVNENMWYIASMGYGIGTVIICIELLLYEKGNNNDKKI